MTGFLGSTALYPWVALIIFPLNRFVIEFWLFSTIWDHFWPLFSWVSLIKCQTRQWERPCNGWHHLFSHDKATIRAGVRPSICRSVPRTAAHSHFGLLEATLRPYFPPIRFHIGFFTPSEKMNKYCMPKNGQPLRTSLRWVFFGSDALFMSYFHFFE